MRGLLVAAALTGCWSASQPAWVAPPTTVEEAPLPECPIRLADDNHVFVWEVDLGAITTASRKHALATYQTGSEAYVALRGGDTLWKVSCDGKKLDTLTIAGADFGAAALHADRRRLFFSHGGVAELDLVTKRHRQLTTPKPASCGPSHDVVTRVTRDHVEFTRGSPCGFEGEIVTTLMRRHMSSGREEKATPITGLVVNDGQIWLAAGDCGEAAIFRSTDWQTWKRFPVPGVQGRITLVSAAPHTLVMATGLCSGTAGGKPATMTRDGGRTWSSISKQIAVEWVRGDALANVRAGAASGDQLRWSDKDGELRAGPTQWTETPALPATVTLEGRTVRPTVFGLYDAATDERLFPR